MVYCGSDGFWSPPVFYDACIQTCPTQPSTSTLSDYKDPRELEAHLDDLVMIPAELQPIRTTTKDPSVACLNEETGVYGPCTGKTVSLELWHFSVYWHYVTICNF